MDDRLYEVGILCAWVFSTQGHELEEQSLKMKEEKASELLPEYELHDSSC